MEIIFITICLQTHFTTYQNCCDVTNLYNEPKSIKWQENVVNYWKSVTITTIRNWVTARIKRNSRKLANLAVSVAKWWPHRRCHYCSVSTVIVQAEYKWTTTTNEEATKATNVKKILKFLEQFRSWCRVELSRQPSRTC